MVVKARKNLKTASCKGPSQPAELIDIFSARTMKLTNRQKKKAENCWDLEHIIKIQEKIIKAQNKTIQYSDDQYWQLHMNALGLKEVYEVQQKELELAYKDRNEAIRRYNALAELGVMAKNMGIDLTEKLPERQRAEWNKNYKFSINAKVLESGRSAYEAKLEKRQSSNGQDFKKNNGRDKKK